MKKRNLFILIIICLFSLLVSCSQAEVDDSTVNNVETDSNRKIVYDINYLIESKKVDIIKKDINKKVIEFNGYIASSTDNEKKAIYTYKIPTEKLNEFLDYVDSYDDKVVEKEISSKDITTNYNAIEAQIEALEATKRTYMNMLNDEDITMSEVISINQSIEEINQKLAYIHNQLASYDNKVDYSSVVIEYKDDSIFFKTYGSYLVDSFKIISKILLYSLPYGITISIVVFLANLPGIIRKRKREKLEQENK